MTRSKPAPSPALGRVLAAHCFGLDQPRDKNTERSLLGFCHGYGHPFGARSDADMDIVGAGFVSSDSHSELAFALSGHFNRT